MNYNDFITDILTSRGRFGIPNGEYKERHHIIPRCLGGLDDESNLIDLYAKEHYIAHKLLAEENPTNKSLVYAWHMMCTCGKGDSKRYTVSSDEYEQARKLWAPFNSELVSTIMTGRHWYTNNEEDRFEYECPSGYIEGRSNKAKNNIGKKSVGRNVALGRHWYNNGIIQVMRYKCPEGFVDGALPMSKEAKLSHSKSMKNNPKLKTRKCNRGFETLYEVDRRIDLNQFKIDFLLNGLTDKDLSLKYNITVKMSKKYRHKYKLFIKDVKHENK